MQLDHWSTRHQARQHPASTSGNSEPGIHVRHPGSARHHPAVPISRHQRQRPGIRIHIPLGPISSPPPPFLSQSNRPVLHGGPFPRVPRPKSLPTISKIIFSQFSPLELSCIAGYPFYAPELPFTASSEPSQYVTHNKCSSFYFSIHIGTQTRAFTSATIIPGPQFRSTRMARRKYLREVLTTLLLVCNLR